MVHNAAHTFPEDWHDALKHCPEVIMCPQFNTHLEASCHPEMVSTDVSRVVILTSPQLGAWHNAWCVPCLVSKAQGGEWHGNTAAGVEVCWLIDDVITWLTLSPVASEKSVFLRWGLSCRCLYGQAPYAMEQCFEAQERKTVQSEFCFPLFTLGLITLTL